ncbi:uncharacterized protein LOC134475968 [Cavia porcellus]|uniref:uncharacterized protein LOC134475968 n=1 Tax=Cavia porcellus TaxID=10141 RepID=UPI002FE34EA1
MTTNPEALLSEQKSQAGISRTEAQTAPCPASRLCLFRGTPLSAPRSPGAGQRHAPLTPAPSERPSRAPWDPGRQPWSSWRPNPAQQDRGYLGDCVCVSFVFLFCCSQEWDVGFNSRAPGQAAPPPPQDSEPRVEKAKVPSAGLQGAEGTRVGTPVPATAVPPGPSPAGPRSAAAPLTGGCAQRGTLSLGELGTSTPAAHAGRLLPSIGIRIRLGFHLRHWRQDFL